MTDKPAFKGKSSFTISQDDWALKLVVRLKECWSITSKRSFWGQKDLEWVVEHSWQICFCCCLLVLSAGSLRNPWCANMSSRGNIGAVFTKVTGLWGLILSPHRQPYESVIWQSTFWIITIQDITFIFQLWNLISQSFWAAIFRMGHVYWYIT